MTLIKPTLTIRKIITYKNNIPVFECEFHTGVNIVRGQNSSGKTTVLDLIAYNLGSENIPWKQEALLCDHTIIEVSLNGKHACLKREISDKAQNPMFIFWGTLQDALEASFEKWEKYSFSRSSSKISFTQALLLAMEMPEAQGDGASNITMHQLLRVLYADQPSLHSPIFRQEPRFDTALTREAVGTYLSGVYDDKLYMSQLEKREIEKQISQIDSELRSIYTVLANSEQEINIETLAQEILTLEQDKNNKSDYLNKLLQDRVIPDNKKSKNVNITDQLNTAKQSLKNQENEILKVELEIAATKKFIEEIKIRLSTLDDSTATRKYFGNIKFPLCPCCLSEIKSNDESNSCLLCKTPANETPEASQILRMRNELKIQEDESSRILKSKELKHSELSRALPELRKKLKYLEKEFTNSSAIWTSDVESAITETARQLGILEQKINNLFEHQRLASIIKDKQKFKQDLVSRDSDLEEIIRSLSINQEYRTREVYLAITEKLGELLRKDLPRQEEFIKAESIQFSFSDNQIVVEGATKFSESSTVVLRHLFHLALLSVSTSIPTMRLPRFMMLDGIEDGGMELPRSHLLQEIIVEECSKFECEYQLIFATSQISPKLEDELYVVGRYFTEDDRSLKITS